jgi:hypothetical protein
MAIIEIPLTAAYDNYDFSVDLDGRSFLFEIAWNTRTLQWSLTIRNDENIVLIGAIPLLVNANLIGRFKLPALPQGILMLHDTSGANLEAVKDDLGVRCQLLYNEAA